MPQNVIHSYRLLLMLEPISFKNPLIEGSSSENFLRVTIDSNFTFEKHINLLCIKGNLKLDTITRCAKLTCTEKRCLIFKAFIISQFNYCPLIWMFHTKELNNRINSMNEKVLIGTYQERNSSFNEQLNLDKSVTFHYGNTQ